MDSRITRDFKESEPVLMIKSLFKAGDAAKNDTSLRFLFPTTAK